MIDSNPASARQTTSEIQVDAGLDQGCGNQPYGRSISQAVSRTTSSLSRRWRGAHQRGQVDRALRVRHALVQLPCVAARVDDAKGLRRLAHPYRQRGVVKLPLMAYPCSFERPVQALRLRSQLPHVLRDHRQTRPIAPARAEWRCTARRSFASCGPARRGRPRRDAGTGAVASAPRPE